MGINELYNCKGLRRNGTCCVHNKLLLLAMLLFSKLNFLILLFTRQRESDLLPLVGLSLVC